VSQDIDKILEERGGKYGHISVNSEFVQRAETHLRTMPGYKDMDSVAKECIHMVLHKIARAAAGDPTYIDNPVDIAGYAKLWADHIQENS
jgi:hypothetical protein